VKVPETDTNDMRTAVHDLLWQTAHLYKDAPGGKLACPQRSKLQRYMDTKMMTFDFLLDKEKTRKTRDVFKKRNNLQYDFFFDL